MERPPSNHIRLAFGYGAQGGIAGGDGNYQWKSAHRYETAGYTRRTRPHLDLGVHVEFAHPPPRREHPVHLHALFLLRPFLPLGRRGIAEAGLRLSMGPAYLSLVDHVGQRQHYIGGAWTVGADTRVWFSSRVGCGVSAELRAMLVQRESDSADSDLGSVAWFQGVNVNAELFVRFGRAP